MITAEVEKALTRVGELYIKAFRDELERQGHRATGELIDSFTQYLTLTTDGAVLEITMAAHGEGVDKGQPPGTIVPLDKLIRWVQLKDIESEITKVQSAASLIQRAIYNEGTPTRGSREMGQKTNFIGIASGNVSQEVADIMNEAISRGTAVLFENLIRDQVNGFSKI